MIRCTVQLLYIRIIIKQKDMTILKRIKLKRIKLKQIKVVKCKNKSLTKGQCEQTSLIKQ